MIFLFLFLATCLLAFSNGANDNYDTPKIAALLLLVKWLTPGSDIALVGVAIAVGGLLGARRVAETMSHKITSLNPGQGVTPRPGEKSRLASHFFRRNRASVESGSAFVAESL